MSDKTECKTIDIESIIGGILAKAATHGHNGVKISIVGEVALIEIMATKTSSVVMKYDRAEPTRLNRIDKFGV